MNAIFSLAMAKFPPSRIPALMEEMRGAMALVLERSSAEAQAKYLAVLDAGAGVESMLAVARTYDVVLVDQDLDSAGYAILDGCAAIERAYAERHISLSEQSAQLIQDARDVVLALFPKGHEIFRYSYLAEWSEVKTLLQCADSPEISKKIARLGFGHFIERLRQCHNILGEMLGIQSSAERDKGEGIARFESAFGELVSVVVLQYARDTDAERQMRELLLGPFKRHLEAYRDEQRRRALRAQAKQTESTSKISITPNAD